MESTAAAIVVIAFLAFLTESMTEYIFGEFIDGKRIRYVALAVGVLVSVLYNVDALKAFFGIEAMIPYVGQIATGLIIGRGATYAHDLYKSYVEPVQP